VLQQPTAKLYPGGRVFGLRCLPQPLFFGELVRRVLPGHILGWSVAVTRSGVEHGRRPRTLGGSNLLQRTEEPANATDTSASWTTGNPDWAESEYRAVLALRSRLLGPEHPNTLTTRHGLARVAVERMTTIMPKSSTGRC
jgi:hypothetical protein